MVEKEEEGQVNTQEKIRSETVIQCKLSTCMMLILIFALSSNEEISNNTSLSMTQALTYGAKTAANLFDSLGCQWVFNTDGLTIE